MGRKAFSCCDGVLDLVKSHDKLNRSRLLCSCLVEIFRVAPVRLNGNLSSRRFSRLNAECSSGLGNCFVLGVQVADSLLGFCLCYSVC